MFDKVVLCSEGYEIYNGLKAHSYSLPSGSGIDVYLLPSTVSLPDNLATVTWNDHISKVSTKVQLQSKHSMLTEMHIVASGTADTSEFEGHHIVVVVGGTTCLAIAYATENIKPTKKLNVTFDFEETNGVLSAKADFDGNITQGILDEILAPVAKTGSYNDLTNKPDIPSAANDSTITVYAGGTESGGTVTGGMSLGSFTVNQSSNKDIRLGEAAGKDVDATIETNSSANVPTSGAVKGYVSGYVHDTTISIKKRSSDSTAVDSFTTNDATANKTLDLQLGTAADLSSETTLTSSSDNAVPTSKAVADYVSGQIGTGTLTISKSASDNTSSASFSANQAANSNITIGLGLGAAADMGVDTSSSGSGSGLDTTSDANVPTSKAVAEYITNQGFLTSSTAGVHDSTVTVYRNSSNDSTSLGSFSVNQSSNSNLELGFGDVVTHNTSSSISASASSSEEIPTVGAIVDYVHNSTITITRNSVSAGSFTLNNNGDISIDIEVPTDTNELTNGAGFITSSDISGKADSTSVPGYAVFDSQNHLIRFKNTSSDSTDLFTLDAADFVRDGMVDNVEVSNGNLVITFNTDATSQGKQTISIALTQIFDPSNYYTSLQTDTAISTAITNLNLGDAAVKGVDTSIGGNSDGNLPTSGAVKSYVTSLGYALSSDVKDSTITIKKNSADTTNPFSFTLNQASNGELNLGLADGAFKGVDSSIGSSSSSNVPTTDAVKSYVTGLGYAQSSSIGDAHLKIYKGSSATGTPDADFSANQIGTDVSLTLGLGTAAEKAYTTAVTQGSSDLVTSGAVESFVTSKGYITNASLPTVNDAKLLIKKHTADSTATDTGFTANASSDVTFDLALGAAADKAVDDTITVDTSTSTPTAGTNLPTSEAVRAFVEGKNYLTSVSNETIALTYRPYKGSNQSTDIESFTLNGIAHRIVLGSASVSDVVYLSGSDAIDTVTGQDDCLVTLGQAKTLANNASQTPSLKPAYAPASGSSAIEVPVGAMVWLALNFSGSVGIMDFTTVSSTNGTPILSGNGSGAQVVAYMAQIRDNAGDFYALENQKLAAGQKFRTTNCMDSSGMAVPSYGFALCIRLPNDSGTSGSGTSTNG